MLRRMHAEPLDQTNEVERRRWNDERRAAVWPKRERLTDAVTGLLLEAAAPQTGERVLDVGVAAAGHPWPPPSQIGADGVVVGADISAPLRALAVERAREAGVANVDFELVDMQPTRFPAVRSTWRSASSV